MLPLLLLRSPCLLPPLPHLLRLLHHCFARSLRERSITSRRSRCLVGKFIAIVAESIVQRLVELSRPATLQPPTVSPVLILSRRLRRQLIRLMRGRPTVVERCGQCSG